MAGFEGVRVESGWMLVEGEGFLVCTRFWTGEGVLGESEEKESLGKMSEMHGCFDGWICCDEEAAMRKLRKSGSPAVKPINSTGGRTGMKCLVSNKATRDS